MRLTKLAIYGFKSFARRTEIIFPQNVTGIVGPNGSGKSNIADAVRWVLGEQSAKTLRGNSMQDVIFNGTELKKPMNYCEVALTFDNADHQLPVDFAEVSITRRVYRSGESEYLLNDGSCRLKDIVDLFRDTGVGKEGYSIIGQGRIDEILSQRSEDRRAVFEEAAGITRYRTRKEEAETRLKRADENLVRVLDVLDELNTHLGPLEKQADVAREYLALSETLKNLDVRLFLTRYDRVRQRADTLEQTLLTIHDSLREANLRLEQASVQRDDEERRVGELQTAVSAAHDALLAANDALHAAKEAAAEVDNRIRSGQETAERLQAEAEAVRTRKALIEATLTQQDGGANAAEQQRAQAQAGLDAQKQALEEKATAAQTLEDELTAHNNAIMEAMNRIGDVKAAKARHTAMQSQLTERRQDMLAKLDAETAQDEAIQGAVTAAEESLAGERERLTALQEQANKLETSAQALLASILDKQKQAQQLDNEAQAAETRLRTLGELQEGYEGYQYAVKSALQYARQRGDSGVQDVVAKLLSVPKELETALDMALGGAMQNIVTQTEEDAKRIIEYLRQNRLGRATFLPMSSVRGRTLAPQERRALELPGCVGVASELVGFDEKYRSVVESLLGRTVVAENLDSGIRIMRAGNHAFRLVTLQGDVMHSGGSMTGGSIQQKAQNLLGRDREIRELTALAKDKRAQIERETQALDELEKRRAGTKEQRAQAQYDLHQQEIAIVRDTEHLSAAQSAQERHNATVEGYREAVAQLDEGLANTRAELERIQRQSERSDIDTDAMNRQTDELSQRLDTARRVREAAQEDVTAAMLHLQEAEHSCETIRRDQKRLLGDSESCDREIAQLAQKRESVLRQTEQAAARQEEAQGAIRQAEREAEAARAHVDERELAREEASKAFKDAQTEIEACQLLVGKETDRLHRQELAQQRLSAEMTQLTDRLWDTYELTYAGAKEHYDNYVSLWREAQAEQADGAADTLPAADTPPFAEAEADEQARGIRERIRAMGTVNVGAIEEYATMRERFTVLSAQKDDLEKAKVDLQALIEQLLDRMKTVFTSQFSLLQEYFSTTFIRLFGGGHGEIQLSDPADPLGCGIEIIVQPPGKKRQLLSLFSGGERALTAIAILFAMLMLKPTPFCILDEIEAALDEANVGNFGDYLKEFSKDTQFIVVTHRKGTMERCDTLFGVAMEEHGVSSMVSVNLTDYQ